MKREMQINVMMNSEVFFSEFEESEQAHQLIMWLSSSLYRLTIARQFAMTRSYLQSLQETTMYILN